MRKKVKVNLGTNEAIVNYFIESCTTAYYCDLDENQIVILKDYCNNEKSFYNILSDFDKGFADYINNYVHPNDQDKLREKLSTKYIKETLKHTDNFSFSFRERSGKKEETYRCIIIKGEDANHAAIFYMNISEEARKEEQLRLLEEANRFIDSFSAAYDIVYVVNLEDDGVEIRKIGGYQKPTKTVSFTEVKNRIFKAIIHPSEVDRMKDELSIDTLKKNIKENPSYSVEFRTIDEGKTRWSNMRITSIGNNKVVIGVIEEDNQIARRYLENKQYNDYLALYFIDVDTGSIRTVKNVFVDDEDSKQKNLSYKERIIQYAEKQSGEAKEFFMRLSDMESLKKEFANEDKHTLTFKSVEPKGWLQVRTYVIQRHEDGTPTTISISFSLMDSFGAENEELKNQLKDDFQMIGGIADSYLALFHYRFDDGSSKIYSLDDRLKDDSLLYLIEGLDGETILKEFANSKLIHPDDKHLFQNLSENSVKKVMMHRKKYSIQYRRLFEGVYQWFEMDIYKFGELDEPTNAIAVGFANRDEEIREEKALESCTEILRSDIDSSEAINELLSIAGEFYGSELSYIFEFADDGKYFRNTYSWSKNHDPGMRMEFNQFSKKEFTGWSKRLKEKGTVFFKLDDSGDFLSEDIQRRLRAYGVESLIIAPIVSGNDIVGFIGTDNPTKALNNVAVINNIAAVSYSEIIKRRQAEIVRYEAAKVFSDTFLDSYVSAYYVNLDDCRQFVFNRSKFIEKEYGHIENYLESARQYISRDVYPDDRAAMYEAIEPEYIKKRLLNEKSFYVNMRDISGEEERWYRFEVTRGSDMSHAGLSFSDITEVIEEEKQKALILEEALEEAAKANKSKTSFLFNMSHDIRTPMNVITGFTEMAKKHIDDKDRVLDYLDKIDVSGQQLLVLINQVLEMARIESGKFEMNLVPTNIIEKFNSMVTILSEQATLLDIDFHYSMHDIKHASIIADEARISSILINVLGNAMKYTPSGGRVDFTLSEKRSTKPGYETYVFVVEDTGIGMSEEYLKELYEPFSREKNSTVSKIQGTGLGLSIVKTLVDVFGGTIEVESKVNKGTKFVITLDFKIDEHYVKEKAVKIYKKGDFVGKRALLVEDNDMNRMIAKDILEEYGFTVEEAEDGNIAVEMVKKVVARKDYHYYDIIFMDVQMPSMNGYDATRAIRAIPEYNVDHIPIIAMTANAFEEDRQNAFRAGMDEHVAKPIMIKTFIETISKVLS